MEVNLLRKQFNSRDTEQIKQLIHELLESELKKRKNLDASISSSNNFNLS